MQPLASLLSLHFIIGCVVGSSLLEARFQTGCLTHNWRKWELITTGSSVTKLVGLAVKGTVALYLFPLAKVPCPHRLLHMFFLLFFNPFFSVSHFPHNSFWNCQASAHCCPNTMLVLSWNGVFPSSFPLPPQCLLLPLRFSCFCTKGVIWGGKLICIKS